MAQAYCVKDKAKVEVQNAQKITMKNGKPALQGTCPKCGGKVFKIGGSPDAVHMLMTEDDQWRKIEVMRKVVDEVWR